MLSCGEDSTLLGQLSESVRECLLSKARVSHFKKGETINLQGEPSKCLKIVLTGWVKLYRVSQNGEEAVLSTLEKGQSFDEIVSLQGKRSPASSEAVSDCSIIFFDLSSIGSCEGAYLEIMSAVMSAASEHIETLMDDIETLKVKTGAERLSEYLVGRVGVESDQNSFVLPYGKTVLAGKLGMKPESLSRAFARLKPFGVNSDKRHVTISNYSALKSISVGS